MRRSARYTWVAVLAVLGVFAMASAAFAAPHFQSATSSVNNNGALVVGFDERGLGNANVDYVLTADASATFACINGGGKHPQAANKETVNTTVSAAGSFEVKNGRVVASLTAGPPSAGSFSCPGGQRLVFASVAYTNIVLTDTTNGEDIGVANVTRTFLNI